MKKLSLSELKRPSVDEYRLIEKHPILLVADNIRSGHNVGSLFRIADAFALEQIILCGISPCPPNAELEKTAIGATRSVSWRHTHLDSLATEMIQMKSAGHLVCAVEQTDQSTMLNQFRFDCHRKYVLIFGNEIHGISPSLLGLADVALEIPQYGTKHSINVSVAAGIVVWEVVKALAFQNRRNG